MSQGFANNGLDVFKQEQIIGVTKEPTGFPNRTDSTFSFDDGTRTFTIEPVLTAFDFWTQGTKHTITTPQTLVLPNTTNRYFIFFSPAGTLGYSTSFDDSLLNDKVFAVLVYYNATTGKAEFLLDERHGLTMDWATHFHLHNAFGTRYYGGFGLSYVIGDGSLDSHCEVALGTGTIADEDIPTTIVDAAIPSAFFEQVLSPTALIPAIYKLGAAEWQKDTATSYPFKTVLGVPQYSLDTLGTYTTEDVTDGNYFAVWLFAFNEIETPIVSVLGHREDISLADAKNNNTYGTIDWGDLPSQEYKILYRLIYQYDTTYTNTTKVALVEVADLRGTVDSVLSSSTLNPVADHGNLIGLNDDDHLQYHNDTRGDLRYPLKTTELTINGVTQDLSANRTWTIPTGGWDNVVPVNSVSDLPTVSGGNRTFLANTAYIFNIESFSDANTWTLANNTVLASFNKTGTIISYTGIGNFINYTNANVLIRDLEIQATTGTIFNVSNTSSFSTYLEQMNFRNCLSLGTITGGGLFLKYLLAVSCGNGLNLAGDLGSVILDTCSFRPMSGGVGSYAIKVSTGTTGNSFRSYNNIFDLAVGNYGIWIEGTYALTSGGILKGNIFSNGTIADRVSGVNGNTTGWTINYGENSGIAGLQFSDVDVVSTADATFANGAGTYVEGGTIRGYVMSLATYDALATVMEAKVEALMTSNEATFQIGVRNLTSATNIGGLQAAVLPGTLGSVQSDYIAITPNRVYNAYYVKTSNTGANVATRFALKLRIKTY